MALAKWLKWLLCFMVADSAAIQVSRLPTAVVPLRYEVTLLPVIEGNARLCGHVWIDLSIQATTNLVILHALNLKILQVVLHKAHNNSRTINTEDTVESACFVSGVEEEKLFSVDPDDLVDEIGMDKRSEVMAVLSKETLNPATTYRLGILYMGNVQEGEKRGFFRVKYTRDGDDVERWLVCNFFSYSLLNIICSLRYEGGWESHNSKLLMVRRSQLSSYKLIYSGTRIN